MEYTYEEAISQIRDRIDIVEIISEDVILKQKGSSYWGCCPFHGEKTPSFCVTPSKGIFHCFGCGVGGDAITFLMKIRNWDFNETIKFLADKYGVELPKFKGKSGQFAEVKDGEPVEGTEEFYSCDTLLLSCGLIPENELSREMGVEINPITNGPCVNESLEASVDGVFACGNVLHVHDLVDFVSQEAATAGKNAAKYILQGKKESKKTIEIKAVDGVRYTVPKTINVENMDDELTVRFRVGNVFKNAYISTYFNDERVGHKKRRVMAPGEMEQVVLKKEELENFTNLDDITIRIEEA